MATFPTNIKYIDGATFTEQNEDAAITEAPMDGGYVVSRARFTRRPRRTWTFKYTMMNDTDKTTLQNFWNTVQGSSDAFDWTNPSNPTAGPINVRFTSKTQLKFSRVGFGPINIWDTDILTIQEI